MNQVPKNQKQTTSAVLPSEPFVVIVTYKREDNLRILLGSLSRQTSEHPIRVAVVDNAKTAKNLVDDFKRNHKNLIIDYLPQDENLGGAGGFDVGMKHALEQGAEWLWIMDDDVEMLDGAFSEIGNWQDQYLCFHGRRLTHKDEPFFYQPTYNKWLQVPLPYIGDPFKNTDTYEFETACFEGMVIHRSIVEKVGTPDPRFFITWDDAVYGWLVAQHTKIAVVNAFFLRRQRIQKTISLGFRPLAEMGDLGRYYSVRNRWIVKEHVKKTKGYSPIGFSVGTVLVIGKELVRTIFVERHIKGVKIIGKATMDNLKKV